MDSYNLMAGDENNEEWMVSKTKEHWKEKKSQSTVWKDTVQWEMPRMKILT